MKINIAPIAAVGLLLAACNSGIGDPAPDNFGTMSQPAADNLEQAAQAAAEEAAEDSRRVQAAANRTSGNEVN